MTIQPHDIGTFLVSSRSRESVEHIVDLAYQEEPWVKPHIQCGCERGLAHGETCEHIRFLVEYLKGLM